MIRDLATARIVVIILGLVAGVCLAGSIFLVATEHQAPDALVGTLGVTVGALAGVLAPKGAGG